MVQMNGQFIYFFYLAGALVGWFGRSLDWRSQRCSYTNRKSIVDINDFYDS